jgi:hypothetical protein
MYTIHLIFVGWFVQKGQSEQEIHTAHCPVIFEQGNRVGDTGLNLSRLKLIAAEI